jgi:O-antigen/teichoic acid export membrane protein
MSSDIRLRFAGIIGFLAQILSLFTGLVFTTIITRNLSIIEYGQWNTISSLIYYGAFASNLLGYWYTRYTARNINIAKTGILVTIVFAIAGIIPFLVAGKLFVAEYDKLFPIILFASIQVITSSIVYNLVAIANAKKPEISTYGFIIFEAAKLVIAFVIVFYKGLTLIDAVTIVIIAESIRAGMLVFLIRKEFYKKVEFENIKKTIKSLWLPFYNRISGLIYTSDVLIVSLLTLSYTHIAMFKVGLVFSTIVQFGSQLAFPLYIKLLGGGKAQDVETTAKLMFTFMIPLAAGIFVLAKPLLYLLNPEYASSEIILQLLVLYSFSLAINDFLYNVIQGNEKIDTVTIKFRDLLHSTLFTLPTLNLIRTGAYISGLVIFIMLTSSHNMSSKTFGETWAIILMVTNIPITIYLSNIVKRKIPFRVPWRNIGKYVLSATVMTIMMLYFMKFLTYNQKTTLFATEIFGIISASMAIYFGILLMIDVETRRLLKDSFALVRK